MIAVVDNYDSFTYNLVQYLGELGAHVVVVRNDESALAELLDTDGGGISLEELGDAGVVLGPDNQDIVLDAVEEALGVLGGPARTLLEPLLGTTGSLSGVVDLLSDVLTTLGATELLDTVVDAVADSLLSNTLTLLQSTSITMSVRAPASRLRLIRSGSSGRPCGTSSLWV